VWSYCQIFERQFYNEKTIKKFLILSTVVASTMFIWDYLLTFGMEVELVWKSKWTFMKGLYLFQRYLPFIDTTWLVLHCQSDDFSTFLPSIFFCSSTGKGFDEGYMCEYVPSRCRFVNLSLSYVDIKRKGIYFSPSNFGPWNCCIREYVRLSLHVLSHINGSPTVLLTLRTWAVWNRNQ